MSRLVYLDYAATTPVAPEVAAAMTACLSATGVFANPSSSHAPGQAAQAVVENARALAATLIEGGLDIVTDGTDTHVVLVDLRPKGLTGNVAEASLERAGLTCNKNGIPFDPEKPAVTSGIRLGTPAGTTRGFTTHEFRTVGRLIGKVLDGLAINTLDNFVVEQEVRDEVAALCVRFPVYPGVGVGPADGS